MRRADLSLSVSQRKLPCVLDPAVLLMHALGPTLAQRLTQVTEPWLTRSFWQVLDASELLLAAESARAGTSSCGLSGAALVEWVALREATDAGSWLLRWIGDRLAESQLRDEGDARLLERWEQLAESLAQRATPGNNAWCHGFDATAAALDTLALSATLGGAPVLCEAGPAARDEPHPVIAARGVSLATRRIEPMPADSLFSAERQLLRHSLAQAGLAALLEDRLRLAAAHVLPGADADATDPWDGARVCWYAL